MTSNYLGSVPTLVAVGLPFDPIAKAQENWDVVGWSAGTAMAAATSISRAHQIVLGRINDALAPLDLTLSRFEALALLHFSRAGSMPLGKIGERLQVHPASVTNTIDRLERDGLVERLPHPDDRRTVLARLTDAGRARVTEAADVLAEVEFGMQGLTDVQQKSIDIALHDLRRAAGDFDAD